MDQKMAVIKTGGKQYKVTENQKLKVEKLPDEKKLEFSDLLSGKKVTASKVSDGRSKKVRVFKFHAKKRYKRNVGHRQSYSLINIDKIE